MCTFWSTNVLICSVSWSKGLDFKSVFIDKYWMFLDVMWIIYVSASIRTVCIKMSKWRISSWDTITTIFSPGLSVPYHSQQSLLLPPRLANHWCWGRLFWFRPGAGILTQATFLTKSYTSSSSNHTHFIVSIVGKHHKMIKLFFWLCFRLTASVTALTASSSSSLAPPTSQPSFTMSSLSLTLLLW